MLSLCATTTPLYIPPSHIYFIYLFIDQVIDQVIYPSPSIQHAYTNTQIASFFFFVVESLIHCRINICTVSSRLVRLKTEPPGQLLFFLLLQSVAPCRCTRGHCEGLGVVDVVPVSLPVTLRLTAAHEPPQSPATRPVVSLRLSNGGEGNGRRFRLFSWLFCVVFFVVVFLALTAEPSSPVADGRGVNGAATHCLKKRKA